MRIVLWLAAALATTASAGTVSSGGGRLSKYAGNPWFLENIPEVRYCIEVDEEAFGVPRAALVPIVEEGLDAWRAAFAAAGDGWYDAGELEPFGAVRLATQRFILQGACSSDLPLRFQFGTLSEEQRAYFANANDYVGAAIRTDYDLTTMSSRGFVYLAPLRGPLKPDLATLHPEAWTAGGSFALRLVLWHELGHIFGIGHGAGGQTNEMSELMNERFPEVIVTRGTVDQVAASPAMRESLLEKRRPVELFRSFQERTIEGCDFDAPVQAGTLGIPIEYRCSRVVVKRDQADVFAMQQTGGPAEHFGTLRWSHNQTNTAMVWLNLPEEQRVFTRYPDTGDALAYKTLLGELAQSEVVKNGSYRSKDGRLNIPVRATYQTRGKRTIVAIQQGQFNDGLFPGL